MGKKGAIIFSNDHWTISLDSIVIIQKWVRGNSRGYGFESNKVFFTKQTNPEHRKYSSNNMSRLSATNTKVAKQQNDIWDKVFKSGPSKFCGRQPLKNLLSPLFNTLSHLFYLTHK